jgi:hypothetical protein
MTTSRPIKKMIPTVVPRNFNMTAPPAHDAREREVGPISVPIEAQHGTRPRPAVRLRSGCKERSTERGDVGLRASGRYEGDFEG